MEPPDTAVLNADTAICLLASVNDVSYFQPLILVRQRLLGSKDAALFG